MSLGIPLEIKFDNGESTIIMPFSYMENQQFANMLKRRLLAVNRAAEDDDYDYDVQDANYRLVNAVIEPMIKLIEKDPDAAVNQDSSFCREAFMLTGKFWRFLGAAKRVDYDRYKQNLERLFHLHQIHKIDPLTPGYEQYVARLIHLMLFEDPVVTFDNYVLFMQDYVR